MAKGIKTGGRKAGTPNRANATAADRGAGSLRELARAYTLDALRVLDEIMRDVTAPQNARVMASRELLDRGWGKAPQALTDADGGTLGPLEIRFVGPSL